MSFAFGPVDNWFGQAEAWAWGGSFSEGLDVTINEDPIHDWLNWQAKFIHDDNFAYMAQEPGTDFQAGVTAGCRDRQSVGEGRGVGGRGGDVVREKYG